MTPEQAREAQARFINESELKESIEEYLQNNPFKKDYASQKAAYEKLVEKIFRLEKYFFHHSHDTKFF